MQFLLVLMVGLSLAMTSCSGGGSDYHSHFSADQLADLLSQFTDEEIELILKELRLSSEEELLAFLNEELKLESIPLEDRRQAIYEFLLQVLQRARAANSNTKNSDLKSRVICSNEIPSVRPNRRQIPSGYELIEISSPQDFLNIQKIFEGETSAKYFRLTRDIDFSGVPFRPIGAETSTNLLVFAGILDGNGFTIKNIDYTETNQCSSGACLYDYLGIFRTLAGTVIDLKLENIKMRGPNTRWVGSLAGWLEGGKVENVILKGSSQISGTGPVGGLVGLAAAGRGVHIGKNVLIRNVKNLGGEVIGSFAGGIIGTLLTAEDVDDQAILSNGFSKAKVYGKTAGGGLVGNLFHGGAVIESCSASEVFAQKTSASSQTYVGGLVGNMGGLALGANRLPPSLLRSFSTGKIKGVDWAGGLIGKLGAFAILQDLFSSGSIEHQFYPENIVEGRSGGSFGKVEVSGESSQIVVERIISRSKLSAYDESTLGGFAGSISSDEAFLRSVFWLKDENHNANLNSLADGSIHSEDIEALHRAQMQDTEVFPQAGFSTSVWSFMQGEYPELKF